MAQQGATPRSVHPCSADRSQVLPSSISLNRCSDRDVEHTRMCAIMKHANSDRSRLFNRLRRHDSATVVILLCKARLEKPTHWRDNEPHPMSGRNEARDKRETIEFIKQ